MTKAKPKQKIVGWLMKLPGDDDSADWVELGELEPEQVPGFVAVPLFANVVDLDGAK